MSFVRQMVLSLVAVALFAGPAAAQTHWTRLLQTRTGEMIAIAYAHVGDNPDTLVSNLGYPYVVYGVLHGRPEGYYVQRFRTSCDASGSSGTTWGFVRWDDGSESRDSLFDLMPEGWGRHFAEEIHCDGYRLGASVEGRAEALIALRLWQTTPP
ncbi:MAG: hypothetical protein Q8R97_06380 [Brevundimonas sp.]|jgi:hypothetical protein|uniref:hypothetical protein n=1 Tax=Brevundimonas sp. TaxID=1871086 RepID=UPI002743354F|nr:hypothetical protein [Brevundimonas sp.]MDP3400731.1 hypothetical protein [Brevundimonas sp.]MDZ4108243.1 hypothetical protein [Brevundimonas sp.]